MSEDCTQLSPFSSFCRNGLSPLSSAKNLNENYFTFGKDNKINRFESPSDFCTPESSRRKKITLKQIFEPIKVSVFNFDLNEHQSNETTEEARSPSSINKLHSKKIKKLTVEKRLPRKHNSRKLKTKKATRNENGVFTDIIENSSPIKTRSHIVDGLTAYPFPKFNVAAYERKQKSIDTSDWVKTIHQSYISESIEESTNPIGQNASLKAVPYYEPAGRTNLQVEQKHGDLSSVKNTKDVPKCNCRRSNCLKFYCECFTAGRLCTDECHCGSCCNDLQYLGFRNETISGLLEKNSDLFDGIEIEKYPQQDLFTLKEGQGSEQKPKKKCNCVRSGCQKKYCECYASGFPCSDACNCKGCLNKYVVTLLDKISDTPVEISNDSSIVTIQPLSKTKRVEKIEITNNSYKNSISFAKFNEEFFHTHSEL